MKRVNVLVAAASSLVVLGASFAAPGLAGAAVNHPDACPGGVPTYSAHETAQVNADMVTPSSGAPGTVLSIQIAGGVSVTSSFSGTAGFSVSDIISSAKADVSSSISQTKTVTVTYGYTFAVPSTWTRGGELHAGARMYKYSWKEYQNEPNCTTTTLKSGNAESPWYAPYSWHNEL